MKPLFRPLFLAGAALLLATVALVVRTTSTPDTASAGTPTELPQLARQAVSENSAESAAAIAALRAAGPDGLQALLQTHAAAIAAHNRTTGVRTASAPAATAPATTPEAWTRLQAALDSVGQQRDCSTSGLFWFTDLAQAEAAARASGKPILSLRLLGNLSDEYSCANSRFFRTTLYSNAEVGRYLRENFVLHWQSVRPVPRITIDMGDGRKIERTITGNSIHYILAADGRVVDALPGLYGPQAFLANLTIAASAAQDASRLTGAAQAAFLINYHQARLQAMERQWIADLARATGKTLAQSADSPPAVPAKLSLFDSPDFSLAIPPAPTLPLTALADANGPAEFNAYDPPAPRPLARLLTLASPATSGPGRFNGMAVVLTAASVPVPPSAASAGVRAFSKSRVENPLLRAGAGGSGNLRPLSAGAESYYLTPARVLTAASAPPSAARAGALSGSKSFVENPMLRAGAGGTSNIPATSPTPAPAASAPAPSTASKTATLASIRARLEGLSTDEALATIATLHAADARLDPASRQLIAAKQQSPTAATAARTTASKTIVENPLVRLLQNLERSIAEDTVRNEYLLHTRLHEWFLTGAAPLALDKLNAKIYAELFLTPDSDPWLGLAPDDVFSALDGAGLVPGPAKY